MPFVVSVFYWSKIRNSYYKWLAFYFLYIFIMDLTGACMDILLIPNQRFYDLLVIPVEFLFFFWLFYQYFRSNDSTRLPIICTGIYLVGLLVDMLYFTKHLFPFSSFSYCIGNLLLLILILRFFIQLINNDAILSYKRNMMFWICTGLLIYFLGSLPYYGLRNTLVYKFPRINIIYNYIALAFDCLMYLMFTFSFIWGKPNSRSSLS